MLAIVVFVGVFALSFLTGNSETLLPGVLEVLAPVFSLLMLAVILCVLTAILTFVATLPFKQKYVIQVG